MEVNFNMTESKGILHYAGFVILNYKDYILTEDCVNDLTSKIENINVVIVDNNSPNESYSILKEKFNNVSNVSVVKSNENGGYSYGNNVGIRYLLKHNPHIKYISIMNPDVKIKNESDYLKILNVLCNNENIAVCTGTQIYNKYAYSSFRNHWKLPNKINGIYDVSFINYFFKRKEYPLEIIDNYSFVDVVSGCFFTIKRDVFEKINFFDENVFLYYEENILASKLRKENLLTAICVESFFYHNHITNYGLGISQQLQSKKITMKSKKYFLKKYVSANRFYSLLISVFNFFDYLLTFIIISLKSLLFLLKGEVK